MKKLFTVIFLGSVLVQAAAKADTAFTIYSPNFTNGGALSKNNEFSGFGCSQTLLSPYDSCSAGNKFDGLNCDGKNIAPTIQWANAPVNTQSFALTVYNPDMPTGGGWWNFIVYNISRNEKEIIGGKIPQGATTITNDSGTKYYMGPCPVADGRPNRYIFTIYALDANLDLPPTTTPGLATYMINRHKIASASMVAIYSRPKI